jgi:hypothetical protein
VHTRSSDDSREDFIILLYITLKISFVSPALSLSQRDDVKIPSRAAQIRVDHPAIGDEIAPGARQGDLTGFDDVGAM